MTGVVGWAAELTESVIADVAGTLLGPSVFGQLREMSAASYSLVDGAAVKTIAHSSVASGGFVSEGEPIQVGVGYVVIARESQADGVRQALTAAGETVWTIGEVVAGDKGVELV